MRLFSLLVALTVLSAGDLASADAVAGPRRCPPGSYGEPSHIGSYCVPADCENDDGCNGSDLCRPYRVCSKRTALNFFRYRTPDGGFPEATLVVDTCDISANCLGDEETLPRVGEIAPGPATCRNGTYCVPRDLPPLPPPGQRRGAPIGEFEDEGSWRSTKFAAAAFAVVIIMSIVVVVLVGRRRR